MTTPRHNPPSRATIEQIVRAVLAELTGGRRASPATSSPAPPAVAPVPSPATLTLANKVVSTSELTGRLAGISQLVVPRGAVFTPAARDELKKHGVTVASAVSVPRAVASPRLLAACVGTNYHAGPIYQALKADGIQVESSVAAELPAAIEVLRDAVSHGGLALLITEQTATALCLANRHGAVRAALGASVPAVDAAVREIGPNLLIVAPTGRSVFEMKQTIRHWVRQGTPAAPASLASLLNEHQTSPTTQRA